VTRNLLTENGAQLADLAYKGQGIKTTSKAVLRFGDALLFSTNSFSLLSITIWLTMKRLAMRSVTSILALRWMLRGWQWAPNEAIYILVTYIKLVL
jgi:hypothetical protein